FKSDEPESFDAQKGAAYQSISIGEKWGEHFDCAWFKLEGQIPQEFSNQPVVALVDLGGEACVYNSDGSAIQGITNKRKGFAFDQAEIKKRIPITDKATGGEKVELLLDAGANNIMGVYELDGEVISDGTINQAELVIFNHSSWQLFLDYELLFKLAGVLEEHSRHRKLIIYALNEVVNQYGDGSDANINRCRKILATELNKAANASAMKVSAIGHAHIDIAWLWPLRETVRKAVRSFSTALKMMEEYPDYKFGASQPHLYQMVKDHHPELYQRVKDQVKNNRWECQGGMWVEADCNISSGESLVRQVLYGKKFFKEEFDQDIDNLWLPDVFGYSAALPQILVKSGINFFMTQKISWNQFNRFPHHTFIWKGLDHTEIYSHFLCNDTYNSDCSPDNIRMFETANQDTDRTDHALLLYGVGDGGGGPSRKHIERIKRMSDLEDLPKVNMEFARDFFSKSQASARDLQTWSGELYLEYHRGTLTTQALVKKKNRQLEILIREVEFLFSLFGLEEYPQDSLERLWKVILLNQFHDIIPGSSINRVYKECHEQYDTARNELLGLLAQAESNLLRKTPSSLVESENGILVYNSLSWDRDEFLDTPMGRIKLKVPSLGYRVIGPNEKQLADPSTGCTATDESIENELIQVLFDDRGFIKSIYDKEEGREIVADGLPGNIFKLFEDQPITYEAWDVDLYYQETTPDILELVSRKVLENSNSVISVIQKFTAPYCELEQVISLVPGSKQIDFETTVDWSANQKMLRVEFPLNIKSHQAAFEIQYGHVHRSTHDNTSWEMAQFEVVAHKWADLSQPDYGVALINDCKYGHKIKGNVISLNLLRSPKSPDPQADMHQHSFSYALFPHAHDHIEGKVIQQAYQFNYPLKAISCPSGLEESQKKFSGVVMDSEQVIIESVKKAENQQAVVFRLYEATGAETTIKMTFGKRVVKAWQTNLLEHPEDEIDVIENSIQVHFRPFEINTIMLEWDNSRIKQ
ncbi:MAG: alpha-mannosidase, partial [Aurantibacter sp.]